MVFFYEWRFSNGPGSPLLALGVLDSSKIFSASNHMLLARERSPKPTRCITEQGPVKHLKEETIQLIGSRVTNRFGKSILFLFPKQNIVFASWEARAKTKNMFTEAWKREFHSPTLFPQIPNLGSIQHPDPTTGYYYDERFLLKFN